MKFIYLNPLVVVVWAEGDAEAVAALFQLSLTLSRACDHAHPVGEQKFYDPKLITNFIAIHALW